MDNQTKIKQFNHSKGRVGELLAINFLKTRNFEIIEPNYKCKFGEIDIIAKIDDVFHFVEVKLRTGDYYGAGREAVTPHKQRTIRNVAKFYLLENKLYNEANCSFDVIEISGKLDSSEVEFLENCF